MRLNSCLVAALALSFVAYGQDPKDDDENEVEVQVMAPEVQQLEDADLTEILPPNLGSFILGVEGQATQDEKDARKAKKQDDRKQDEKKPGKRGVIEREIDLGDGQTMKIVISGGGEGLMRGARTFGTFKTTAPEFRVFRGGEKGTLDPHGFHVELGRGEMKDHIDRAMRAFERAREEFIRAFKEGEAGGPPPKGPGLRMIAPEGIKPVIERHLRVERREHEEGAEEKAEKPEKTEAAKPRRFMLSKPAEVQVLGTGAAVKQSREIDELRKEIKELEKMVRELKEQIGEKK